MNTRKHTQIEHENKPYIGPYIGIDVAKNELVIFIDPSGEKLTCPNTDRELSHLAKHLKKLTPSLIVLEASGGYERRASDIFLQHDLPVAVVYPRRVRQFAFGLGMIAKTDEIDARLIAYYGRIANINPQPRQTKELGCLRSLNIRRSQLIEMRLAEQCRLDTAHISIRKNIKQHIAWIERQIEKMDLAIEESVKSDPALNDTVSRLRSVPGVGPVLSSTLITELPELGILSNKKIASLVGVAPFPRQSGKSNGKRFCKGGRNQVRRVLYMATVSAIRYNQTLKTFYLRLCSNGKLKKVALIATSRKLLSILNSISKNHSSWSPSP